MHLLKAVLLLGVAALAPLSANSITYTYAGNDFTNAPGPDYSTSDFVSGTITLANPLSPNSPLAYILPSDILSWKISDQVYSISSSSPGSPYLFLSLATDASGDISTWEFMAGPSIGAFEDAIQIYTENDGYQSDLGELSPFDGGYNEYKPGKWTAVAPEPGNAEMIAAVACLFLATRVLIRKRWPRPNAPGDL